MASARWPECVDDVYILVDYGRHWAETGRLEWTTGERVEGFSSLVLVVASALATLGGLAPELALKAIALLSAAAILAVTSKVLPTSRWGALVVVGLGICSPFAYWAGDGMDAMLFALVLAAGWFSLLRGTGHCAFWLLALSAAIRPEGIVHFGAAAFAVSLRERTDMRSLPAMVGPSLALACLFGLRLWWFREPIPTPALLKIVATPYSVHGIAQALGDVVPFLGLLVAVMPAGSRWREAGPWISILPLLIQIAVLVRASGDWMTHSRLLLPGAIATIVCLGSMVDTGASRLRWGIAVPLVALGGLLQPVGYGQIDVRLQRPPSPAEVGRDYARGLVTPLPEDVAWVVEHVPDGGRVLVNDVGFMGGIQGIHVLDLCGLTTRAIAEASAAGDEDAWLRRLLLNPVGRPFGVRLAFWGEAAVVPGWLFPSYPRSDTLRYPGGEVVWYYEGSSGPTNGEVARRWEGLQVQHPQHAWIAWRSALAADTAHPGDGDRIRSAAASRFPFDQRFVGGGAR